MDQEWPKLKGQITNSLTHKNHKNQKSQRRNENGKIKKKFSGTTNQTVFCFVQTQNRKRRVASINFFFKMKYEVQKCQNF